MRLPSVPEKYRGCLPSYFPQPNINNYNILMLMMKMNDSMGAPRKNWKESQILKIKTHEPNAL